MQILWTQAGTAFNFLTKNKTNFFILNVKNLDQNQLFTGHKYIL